MRLIILSFIYFLLIDFGYSQNLQKRIILFGDAGEINHKQSSLIHTAEDLVIKDSTLVFFLGDNIYPNGMGLDGLEREDGIKSLHAQFEPFQKSNVPLYFMAGNHDWNVSRPGGLEKLIAQETYLKSLNDAHITFVPKAGEPGPVSINITNDFTIIAYDSEYWLYPYHSEDINITEQRKIFVDKLRILFEENKDKTVLVLSHHPMVSYGEHSLSFGWKQHVFPLTRLNKNWYLPLPIIGSIYPLWRGKLFASAEDIPSKEYQELIKSIMVSKGTHKNVLFAAGHDHGLQYIDDGNLRQVVSGSGSKSSFIVNNKDLKYKFSNQGFCVADCLDNGSIVLSYYIFKDSNAIKAYEEIIVKK